MRPRVPHRWMRWKGTHWVETVKSSTRPSPKSSRPLVVRSVRSVGSRSTRATARRGFDPRKKRPANTA